MRNKNRRERSYKSQSVSSYEDSFSTDVSGETGNKSFIGNIDDLERRPTDPLFTLVLLGVWAAVIWIGFYSVENGDINVLLRGKDYNGRECGVDYHDDGSLLPEKWYVTDFAGNGKCIEKCPKETEFDPQTADDLICKDASDIFGLEGCIDPESGNITTNALGLILCGGCMYEMRTYDVMNFCLPGTFHELYATINKAANETGFDEVDYFFDDKFLYVGKFARDLVTSWKIILISGIGGSSVLGFLYLVLLRLPVLSSLTIWASVCLMPFTLAIGGLMCGELSTRWSSSEYDNVYSDTSLKFLSYTSYGLYFLALLCAMLLIYLRKRIGLAIGITKAAAKSVSDVPSTLLHPFAQLLFFGLTVGGWAYITMLLASTGNPVEKSASAFGQSISFTTYQFDQSTKYWFWFLLFSFFWTSEFILAIGEITLSLCFSKWYFTEDRQYGVETNLCSASVTAMFYHSGTAAIGSLLIATTQFARSILLWIQTQLNKSGVDNKFTQCILSCFQCCFCVLERCLKFINKNAYTHTAIFGYSFCKSSYEAFQLILHNAVRFAAIGVVQEVAVVFCRLFIVAGTTLLTAYVLLLYKGDQLYSLFSMVAVVAVLSWFISSMFIGIFCNAITTVTQCFLVDEEMFKGIGSMYVPPELERFILSLDSDDESSSSHYYN
mmetsp:Transcript_2005/g.4354  ORF Transcript_2005/g.4354 Transcript_2005/m.4354 type:complete len:665 (+) Transcript_2005:178-2172(+)